MPCDRFGSVVLQHIRAQHFDADQRRQFLMEIDQPDEKLIENVDEMELDELRLRIQEEAVELCRKHSSLLDTRVHSLQFSKDRCLLSVSSDPSCDRNEIPTYFPLNTFERPQNVKTILRSSLLELDRIANEMDLVAYWPEAKTAKPTKVVFKYMPYVDNAQRMWDEINIWMRLPPHPHIVLFDRIVLDELQGHAVGFTATYISGGSVELKDTFKLAHQCHRRPEFQARNRPRRCSLGKRAGKHGNGQSHAD